MEKRKILIVAAHPDDEVLGCGATISKHVDNKDIVWVLILGEGITSRNNLTKNQKSKSLKKLQNFAKIAGQILGINKLILKKFPDNKFDSVPLLKIVYAIETVVNEFKPNIIYTHHASDVNIDHQKVFEAVQVVIRPQENSSIDTVLSFETPSSTEWSFLQKPFSPNVFVSLNKKHLEIKIAALKSYKSEVRAFPHPRSTEYIEALAKVRGGQSGYQLAEAFELVFSKETTII